MGVHQGTCYWLDCDGCDGWDDEDVYHFDSHDQGLAYAKSNGWLILPDRLLCPVCAAQLDCTVTGHQWEDGQSYEQYGVSYWERGCRHCGASESDPPRPDLRLLLQLAREVDESEGGAAA
jgi:hypothetical protein